MRIAILVNNPASWAVPYADQLAARLARDHDVVRCERNEDIPNGDCAFLLSCSRIVPKSILDRNTHNIVIHASDLPRGKGFAPSTWQVLEGKNEIPVTCFEAVEDLDAGPVYARDVILLDGTELHDEIRMKLWSACERLIDITIASFPSLQGVPQQGISTTYHRRTREHDQLDPEKTIAEQFNALRVAKNDEYPAWFSYRGKRYTLKIDEDHRDA
jgi:methionyl-tRNA formyltransferase